MMVLNDFGSRAQWLDLVQEHGFGSTKAQQILIAVLTHMNQPLTADEIWGETKTIRPKTGRATVYRFIEKLSEVGLLQQVHGYRTATTYVPAINQNQILMVCGCTGKVVYVDSALHSQLIDLFNQQINPPHQNASTSFHLQIYGTCANCGTDCPF